MGAAEPLDVPFTEQDLAHLEARARQEAAAPAEVPAAEVRQNALTKQRLVRQVRRDRRFIAHLVELAKAHGLTPPRDAPADERSVTCTGCGVIHPAGSPCPSCGRP